MIYTFDGKRFDPATGELWVAGQACRLAPQPARALALLLERPQMLVTRAELAAAIWPGEQYGLSQRVTYTIHRVREALGPSVAGDSPIETVPGRGYRFRVPVDSGETPGPAVVPSPPTRENVRPRLRRRHRLSVGFALAAALMLLFAQPTGSARENEIAIHPQATTADREHWAEHRASHQGNPDHERVDRQAYP